MAVDIHLDVEGIQGESRDEKYMQSMEIQEYSWGMISARDSFAGGGGAVPRAENFTVVKRVDAATPKFIACLLQGRRIRKVTTAFRKAGLQADGKVSMDFFVIVLEDVFVAGWKPAGMDGEAPLERVTFNFRKLKVLYRAQKDDGTPEGQVEVSWDAAAHR